MGDSNKPLRIALSEAYRTGRDRLIRIELWIRRSDQLRFRIVEGFRIAEVCSWRNLVTGRSSRNPGFLQGFRDLFMSLTCGNSECDLGHIILIQVV